ncbi:hypothetical protein AB0M28_06240 [Streptomyces sp. NPDC051940]|uniref:hypothetical protein n=1 Tax=Streptomyces sp. NPDC051940 TaxID=3155675 RepID=UPI00343D773F
MTGLVVVYDAACGDCSDVAARLDGVLAPPVRARACRDPHLPEEFPVLADALGGLPCRRPLLVVLRPGGQDEVLSGAAMMWRAARLVAPRRRFAAARLGLRVLWAGRPGVRR